MLFLKQSEKKQILRRLNQNLKAQSTLEEVESPPPPPLPDELGAAPHGDQADTERPPSSNRDRKKWDAAGVPELPVTLQTLEENSSTITSKLTSAMTKLS